MSKYGENPFDNPLGHPGGPPANKTEYEERWVTNPKSFEPMLVRTPKFRSDRSYYEEMERQRMIDEAGRHANPPYSAKNMEKAPCPPKKDKPNKILLLEDI